MAVLLDSNADQDDQTRCFGVGRPIGEGQSLTTPNDGVNYTLDSCKWRLANDTGATGHCVACVHSHQGVYGVSSKPLALLATSDEVDVSGFGAEGDVTFLFSGAERIVLAPNTHYVATCETVDVTDNIRLYGHWAASVHSGNWCWTFGGGLWTTDNSGDYVFYVYGVAPAAAGGAVGGFQGFAHDLTLTLRKPFTQRFPLFKPRMIA